MIGIYSQLTHSKLIPVLFRDAMAPLLLLCILTIAKVFALKLGKLAHIRPSRITEELKFLRSVVISENEQQFEQESWLRLPAKAFYEAHVCVEGARAWIKTEHLGKDPNTPVIYS